jgi:peptide deformylase
MNIEDLTKGGTVRTITRWSEPVMHERTSAITSYDDALHEIIQDMFATMRVAEGVGLAATQIGLGIALFVFDCPDADLRQHVGAICNPIVELPQGKERTFESSEEGCLSFPGAYEALARPDSAICRGQDPWGNDVEVTGSGLLARCLQHETDHLNGVVFGDRLSGRSRRKLTERQETLNHLYPSDWPVSPKKKSAGAE